MFFAFTFLAGLVSVVAPLFILRRAARKWHIDPKIFWKAGFGGLVVSVIILFVSLNIDSAFPAFDNLSALEQALILGVATGLFMELGKFVVLDRIMPHVRSREAAF